MASVLKLTEVTEVKKDASVETRRSGSVRVARVCSDDPNYHVVGSEPIAALDFELYLAQQVWSGCYERIIIVNRAHGGAQLISPGPGCSEEWGQMNRMNWALSHKASAIARILKSTIVTIPATVLDLCASYFHFKVHRETLADLGVRWRPTLFSTTNTLIVIHGDWPVVREGEVLIRNYKHRENEVMIIKIRDRHSFIKRDSDSPYGPYRIYCVPDFTTVDVISGQMCKTMEQVLKQQADMEHMMASSFPHD
jgi:hypothetical protein